MNRALTSVAHSVAWVLFCKVKGHWFDTWWGMGSGQEAMIDGSLSCQCCSLSFSPFLPLSLKKKLKTRMHRKMFFLQSFPPRHLP